MDERQDHLKPSKKLLGMSVYSIQEGQNLGQVKNLVIDAKEKCLLALVIEKRRLTKGSGQLFSQPRSPKIQFQPK